VDDSGSWVGKIATGQRRKESAEEGEVRQSHLGSEVDVKL